MAEKCRRVQISEGKRTAVLKAHRGICYYCKEPDGFFVDHIVPVKQGGTSDLGNLTASCLACNLRKNRHRLPPKAEQKALADATEMEVKIRLLMGSHSCKDVDDQTSFVPITGTHCVTARAALCLSVRDLATMTGLTPNTIVRFEKSRFTGAKLTYGVMKKMRETLEAAGAIMTFDDQGRSVTGIRSECLPAHFTKRAA